ncbi:uncharacterized protein BDR25DRAFT_312689 [Lindgomyces ingoldianus]|uniref:Uncharacterized protein n=1 Tax=Lindgomyces ingoldianus TaxID=673940 RepID=A0ACB6R164_9PLEO|nr:uncharacterized protein BDR25DRAFT_312689 [Lindgomyces ingoldianus]KAF2472787.1 hypothetical protein BDR25DRAFT_312689 [Lindgomyces ingoldianus]
MATILLAPIERLPIELLEPIFFRSNNIHLPLASHVVGTKLSTELAFKTLSIRILFKGDDKESQLPQSPDVSLEVVQTKTQHIFWPLTKSERKRRKDKAAREALDLYTGIWEGRVVTSPQYRIFSAKFMTFERFKKYLAIALGSEEVAKELLEMSLHTVNQLSLFGSHLPDAMEDPIGNEIRMTLKYWCLHSALPLKFMRPPFSRQKAEFLHLLLRLQFTITAAQRQEVENQLKPAMEAAISEPNEVLLACLFSSTIGFLVSPTLLKRVILSPEISASVLTIMIDAHYFHTDQCLTHKCPLQILPGLEEIPGWSSDELTRINDNLGNDQGKKIFYPRECREADLKAPRRLYDEVELRTIRWPVIPRSLFQTNGEANVEEEGISHVTPASGESWRIRMARKVKGIIPGWLGRGA